VRGPASTWRASASSSISAACVKLKPLNELVNFCYCFCARGIVVTYSYKINLVVSRVGGYFTS
jgi:hypothetical protein